MTGIDEITKKLNEAKRLLAYWQSRRKGQVNNCPSDSEHHLQAIRDVQKYTYQLEKLNANSDSRN